MIGIVFASEEEALPFLQQYHRGRFEGLNEGEFQHDGSILVALTGLGKIKATLRTERMLRQHKLKKLLHVGTCTSLSEEIDLGDVVAAAQVFEGDRIELAAPSYPRMPLEVPFDALRTGTLVTQDHTAADQSELSYWQRIADFSDMSGYAMAYVAATHGVPCHIVKVVTGRLQQENKQLRKTLDQAHQQIADFLIPKLEAWEKEAA